MKGEPKVSRSIIWRGALAAILIYAPYLWLLFPHQNWWPWLKMIPILPLVAVSASFGALSDLLSLGESGCNSQAATDTTTPRLQPPPTSAPPERWPELGDSRSAHHHLEKVTPALQLYTAGEGC